MNGKKKMKRSDVITSIAFIIANDYDGFHDAERVLSYLEDIGMLPPLTKCKLVPDERDGCMKHSESKREWDDETK